MAGILNRLFGSDANVRAPQFDGILYPADADELRARITALLADADTVPDDRPFRGILVPLSDLSYCGPVAATAYARLTGKPKRVVLLGPSQRVPFRGLALPSHDAFETPLGNCPVDDEARETLLEQPRVRILDQPHEPEPSLEVQLPWLQVCFDHSFEILPVLVGDVSHQDAVAALDPVLDDETLLVSASELSRDHAADLAREQDQETAEVIVSLDPSRVLFSMVTARVPVQTIMSLAAERGWAAETLAVANSGDTADETGLVVGYGAFAFA